MVVKLLDFAPVFCAKRTKRGSLFWSWLCFCRVFSSWSGRV